MTTFLTDKGGKGGKTISGTARGGRGRKGKKGGNAHSGNSGDSQGGSVYNTGNRITNNGENSSEYPNPHDQLVFLA